MSFFILYVASAIKICIRDMPILEMHDHRVNKPIIFIKMEIKAIGSIALDYIL